MKICILAAANSIHTIKWANALAARGNTVDIISLAAHINSQDFIHPSVKVLPLRSISKFGYYLCAPALKKILKNAHYDIINAHYASGYGTLARLAKASPLVLSVWGSDVYDFPYKSKHNHKIICANLQYARTILSASDIMAEQVKTLVPNRKNDIFTVSFGVDLSKFNPANYPARAADSAFTVVFAKTLKPLYGLETAIRAFSVLKQSVHSEVRFEIYGKGPCLAELLQLTKNLGLESCVHFHGYIPNEQLPAALSRCDVFVSTSIRESFGVAIIEAMAMQLPVIATETDGAKEIITDGITGFLVPVGNAQAMAEKLLLLFNDYNLRTTIGKQSKAHVESLYDLKNNTDTLLSIFESVSKNNKGNA